jgi:hypothetical protein
VPAHKGLYQVYTLNTGLKATVHMEKHWDMYFVHTDYTNFVAKGGCKYYSVTVYMRCRIPAAEEAIG